MGEKDEDLDDLDKLMDIIEAEITSGVVESSIKKNSNLEINKSCIVKNANRNETIPINQPKIIESQTDTTHLTPLKEEVESINTLETNLNSLSSCTSLRSPLLSNRKRSISPYAKYLNKCSTTIGKSTLQSRSISPIRGKNLTPIQYSPPKSQNPLSQKKTYSSLSLVISPNKKQLSSFSRKSRSPLKRKSTSRSPNISPAIKKSYSSTTKLIRSKIISPTIQCVNNKIIDYNYLQKTVKPIDRHVEMRPINPVLEVRKKN